HEVRQVGQRERQEQQPQRDRPPAGGEPRPRVSLPATLAGHVRVLGLRPPGGPPAPVEPGRPVARDQPGMRVGQHLARGSAGHAVHPQLRQPARAGVQEPVHDGSIGGHGRSRQRTTYSVTPAPLSKAGEPVTPVESSTSSRTVASARSSAPASTGLPATRDSRTRGRGIVSACSSSSISRLSGSPPAIGTAPASTISAGSITDVIAASPTASRPATSRNAAAATPALTAPAPPSAVTPFARLMPYAPAGPAVVLGSSGRAGGCGGVGRVGEGFAQVGARDAVTAEHSQDRGAAGQGLEAVVGVGAGVPGGGGAGRRHVADLACAAR